MDKLTYKEAAQMLDTSVQALRNKVSNLGISLARDGNRAYFTREQIEQLQPRSEADKVKIFLELTRNQANALHQFCLKNTEANEGTREAISKLVEALAEVKP